MTFWNAGYRNVTCTFGPDALTDDHLAAFREFGVRRVLLGAEMVAQRLLAAGIECFLLALPLGMDVNEAALEVPNSAQALGEIIRKAAWLGKGVSPSVPVLLPVADAPPAAVPVETEPSEADAEDDLDEPADLDDDGSDLGGEEWGLLEEETDAHDEDDELPQPPSSPLPRRRPRAAGASASARPRPYRLAYTAGPTGR